MRTRLISTSLAAVLTVVAITQNTQAADAQKPNIVFILMDTENHATDYQNGILSDLEVLAVKRFKCGAGLGVVGSWIEQITDDGGTTADALNGFRGRAFGVGPELTYSAHVGKHHLDFNARWIHEFENKTDHRSFFTVLDQGPISAVWLLL